MTPEQIHQLVMQQQPTGTSFVLVHPNLILLLNLIWHVGMFLAAYLGAYFLWRIAKDLSKQPDGHRRSDVSQSAQPSTKSRGEYQKRREANSQDQMEQRLNEEFQQQSETVQSGKDDDARFRPQS